MAQLIIEMTEAQLLALDIIAVDKQDWADNVLTDRARVAMADLKGTEAWTQAIAALAEDGGEISDDEAVLLKGRELELFKTAAEVEAIRQANEVLIDTSPTLDPLEIPLTKRQINAALIQGAGITDPGAYIRDALSSITDPTARALAINDWDYKPTHERTSGYFNDPDVMAAANLTSAQIDGLWTLGAGLPA